jgi:hypothetical protein
MLFLDAARMMFDDWKAGDKTPYILLGPPGIGKSAIPTLVAEMMTKYVQSRQPAAGPAICRILDTTTKMPEDIPGLPHIDKDGPNPVTRFASQSWMAELCEPGAYGVLCFDDGTQALQSVQLAMRQVLLQREVHDAKLSDNVLVIVTGNRREDKSGAAALPAHFINACSLHTIQPDFASWALWYGEQSGLDPVVPSFLRWRLVHFHKTPADADSMGRFATPRTWAKLGARLPNHRNHPERLLELSAGLVGEGVGIEFVAFVNTRSQLVEPERVLQDPERALPNPKATLDTPDKAYALITGLGEAAAQWAKSGDKKKTAEHGLAFLRAIGWASDGNREFISVALDTFVANGGSMAPVLAAAQKAGKDPLVKGVIDHLAKALK